MNFIAEESNLSHNFNVINVAYLGIIAICRFFIQKKRLFAENQNAAQKNQVHRTA
jgi:hypothetical protein